MFSAFLIASVILAVTPGPGVLYIVTRSLTQGRRFGLALVAGVALGNLGNAAGASIGLAAVFAVSALAFTVVKYLGALYPGGPSSASASTRWPVTDWMAGET